MFKSVLANKWLYFVGLCSVHNRLANDFVIYILSTCFERASEKTMQPSKVSGARGTVGLRSFRL